MLWCPRRDLMRVEARFQMLLSSRCSTCIPSSFSQRKLLVLLLAGSLAACSSVPKKTSPASKPAVVKHGSTPAELTAAKLEAKRKGGPKLARRMALVETLHGVKVADPYRWLEKLDGNPEAKTWLAAQDAFARATLAKLPDRAALQKRLAELSYVEAISAPRRHGRRYFFWRRHKNKEKAIWYWRQGKRGKAHVLLDPNTFSKDGSVALRGVSVSRTGKHVAYKKSENAADAATLYVREVKTGKDSPIDVIKGAKYAQASWTPDGKGFYYTRLPVDPSIPVADLPGHAAIYFHKLGTDPTKDRLVHKKTGDPRTFLYADLSRDGRYLFVYKMYGWTRTDVYYRDLRRHRTFQKLVVGLPAKSDVYAWRGRFYLRTNYRAPNYRLFRIDPKKTELKQWEEIVPERQHAVLRDFAVVGGFLSLNYLQKAHSHIEIRRLDGTRRGTITLPGIGTAHGLIGNPEDDTAYYTFSSFITPPTIYETSVRRGKDKLYFKLSVPVDPSPYLVEQVFYPSKDKTKISMFIVRRKDLKKDGSTPFRLYGYGGFDISITPRFHATDFVWLDAGGGLAFPNLRGGGEYGESWHQAGMRQHKQNVFDDFIAAAEDLIKSGYTKSERLAIRGGSNGGLLVGATMVQRPKLFRAVICAVPLLDMVRYHLFGSGKTWIAEYGSADDPKLFPAILAYSPYHNIKQDVAYPALLMLSAENDDRVDPMHARKFVAALRYADSGPHPILLRVETKSGHGGGDMIKKRVAQQVDTLSFLFSQLGMKFVASTGKSAPNAPTKPSIRK